MKNKELFDKTIGILVNAYLNDTLENANCHACAVGNLVATNCGYEMIQSENGCMWQKNGDMVNAN